MRPTAGSVACSLMALTSCATMVPAGEPGDATTSAQFAKRPPTATADTSAPAVDPSRLDLRIRDLRDGGGPHSTLELTAVEQWVQYAIVVHAPSLKDDRMYSHDHMLDVLFHPHDQPPGVIYVYSSVHERLEYDVGRATHQAEPETAKLLQSRFGDFAVLVLDHEGHVLLESREPIHRQQVHEVMGYRDGTPSGQDGPRPGM